jgi:Holliday junction DNA helicase RuvB
MRPETLDEYIGQNQIKEELRVFLESYKKRNRQSEEFEALEHTMLHGPSGTGKTTLARIIANELDVKFVEMDGPTINSQDKLKEIVRKAEKGSIVFIDEIHRVSVDIQERLYPVLEDFQINIFTESGYEMPVELDEFTFIGATTEMGKLTKPFKDRFGKDFRLHLYKPEELAKIVNQTVRSLGFRMTDEACLELAKRSRQTPRKAKRLCKTVRDYVVVEEHEKIGVDKLCHIFDRIGVSKYGLKNVERKYLETLCDKRRPVSLRSLADTVSESMKTIQDAIEPFLVRHNFIQKSSKGRKITDKGLKTYNEIKG